MEFDYLPRSPDAPSSVLRCDDTFKKLESTIFNSISLGQWELARASFRSLALSGDANTQDNAKELLKILVMEAPNYWCVVVVVVVVVYFLLVGASSLAPWSKVH